MATTTKKVPQQQQKKEEITTSSTNGTDKLPKGTYKRWVQEAFDTIGRDSSMKDVKEWVKENHPEAKNDISINTAWKKLTGATSTTRKRNLIVSADNIIYVKNLDIDTNELMLTLESIKEYVDGIGGWDVLYATTKSVAQFAAIEQALKKAKTPMDSLKILASFPVEDQQAFLASQREIEIGDK